MKGLIIMLGIIAIVAIVPLSNSNTAFALCKSEVDVKAAYDYQLPKYSGSYDPCDNWLEWTMEFHRTGAYYNGKGISI